LWKRQEGKLPTTVLEVAEPECVAEEFDGEIVALNVGTGIYCSMREAGAALWRDLIAGHSVESLAQALAAAGGDSKGFREFVDTIIAQGLMRPTAPLPENPSVPEFLDLAMTNPAGLIIEVFFDMKSLLLLDPVHEVDDAKGWPTQPEKN
jgi:hypothetical protein